MTRPQAQFISGTQRILRRPAGAFHSRHRNSISARRYHATRLSMAPIDSLKSFPRSTERGVIRLIFQQFREDCEDTLQAQALNPK